MPAAILLFGTGYCVYTIFPASVEHGVQVFRLGVVDHHAGRKSKTAIPGDIVDQLLDVSFDLLGSARIE